MKILQDLVTQHPMEQFIEKVIAREIKQVVGVQRGDEITFDQRMTQKITGKNVKGAWRHMIVSKEDR